MGRDEYQLATYPVLICWWPFRGSAFWPDDAFCGARESIVLRPVISRLMRLAQGRDALARGRLGEAEGVALGDDDVGVAEQPVNGRCREGFGHDLVESIWGWCLFP